MRYFFISRPKINFFKYAGCICTIWILFPYQVKAQTPNPGITVANIWDKAPYNSFTSLIRFNHAFYCAFREGTSHVSAKNDGRIRILRSADGGKWNSIALMKIDGIDLRDPKLSVTPDHKLMVILAGAVFNDHIEIQRLFPMVSFSNRQGERFSKPEKVRLDPAVSPVKDWIWRVTWHHGTGYGIDYHTINVNTNGDTSRKEAVVTLMKTDDAKYFQKISRLPVQDFPNESTIRFDQHNNLFVLVRRDGGDKMGVLLKSVPPYLQWTYTKLSYRLGGPDFLFLDHDHLVIGTRYYGTKKNTTAVLVTDRDGEPLKIFDLPSGGDTGYPGMVIYKDTLWVSYYSAHQGKPAIYLAKIPIDKLYP